MRFSVLATLATLGSGALSALTGVQVVQNIDTITTKSRVLIEPVKQLSIMNAPLLLIGQGPWPVSLDHPFHSLGRQRRHMQKGHRHVMMIIESHFRLNRHCQPPQQGTFPSCGAAQRHICRERGNRHCRRVPHHYQGALGLPRCSDWQGRLHRPNPVRWAFCGSAVAVDRACC